MEIMTEPDRMADYIGTITNGSLSKSYIVYIWKTSPTDYIVKKEYMDGTISLQRMDRIDIG